MWPRRPPHARPCALAVALLLGTTLPACRSRGAERTALPPGAERLTGVWDAAFVVERPPVGTDAEALHRTGRDQVTGAISFLPLSDRQPAVVHDLPELGTAVPVAYAVWDVDFSPAGFDARLAGPVPAGVAGIDTGAAVGGAVDSVRIVLGPAAPIRVALAGTWRGDSLVGRWWVLTGSRTGLAVWGRFTLAPRPAPTPSTRVLERR